MSFDMPDNQQGCEVDYQPDFDPSTDDDDEGDELSENV